MSGDKPDPPSAAPHPQQTLPAQTAPGVIHDGVQPVCDGQHRAVHELCPNGHLDEVISLQVDGSRGLIQDQDPGFAQESSGQAHQLPLANTASTESLQCPTAHSHCAQSSFTVLPKTP